MFGQASNILKRQGGYLFIDGIRILSWIDEPQMIEFQNLRSSMQANLFTMKIRNVNPKCEAPRPSRQDGTGTAGPFHRSHGSELVEELPGTPVANRM